MSLEINTTEEQGALVVKVAGEVDLYSSPDLRKTLTQAAAGDATTVAVDLGEVTYMDSSGVATLVEGLRASTKNGGSFVLLAPSTPVMKVLQLSRLDTIFQIRDTL